jgi:Protein of unknown function (DUF3106)
MKLFSYIVVAAFLLSSRAAWGQPASPGDTFAQNEQQSLERWQDMTPQEKQDLRDRFQRWKSLPPQEKADLQKRIDNWRRLSPDEKATVRKNYERWQHLSPEQRERLRQRWQDWRQLPPEQRQELKERFERFRDLPPEERRALRERFREKFKNLSPEEKQEWREKFREQAERLSPEQKQHLREKWERLSAEEKKRGKNPNRTGPIKKRIRHEYTANPRADVHSFLESNQLRANARNSAKSHPARDTGLFGGAASSRENFRYRGGGETRRPQDHAAQ